jgi:excisionase family DNA binding protein
MSSSHFFRQPPPPPPVPLALRPRDAAAAIGISVSTLERLTRSGEISSVTIGTCRIYPLEDLRDFLEACRESARSSAD